jgi:hypothetical protein
LIYNYGFFVESGLGRSTQHFCIDFLNVTASAIDQQYTTVRRTLPPVATVDDTTTPTTTTTTTMMVDESSREVTLSKIGGSSPTANNTMFGSFGPVSNIGVGSKSTLAMMDVSNWFILLDVAAVVYNVYSLELAVCRRWN